MHSVIVGIEACLRAHYTPAHHAAYRGDVALDAEELDIQELGQALGYPLPPLFSEYYTWLLGLDFPPLRQFTSAERPRVDERWEHPSPWAIYRDTHAWEDIQARQPTREWKRGFVAISGWNDNYVLVIDTLGAVGPAGCLLWWDYKGGGGYGVQYPSVEHYLECRLRLLEKGLYFEPDTEADKEDFYYGIARETIEQLELAVNGPTVYVDWP